MEENGELGDRVNLIDSNIVQLSRTPMKNLSNESASGVLHHVRPPLPTDFWSKLPKTTFSNIRFGDWRIWSGHF